MDRFSQQPLSTAAFSIGEAYRKQERMLLQPATEADYPAITDLANLAFRGSRPEAGWNSEADYIAGPG
jgi:hypothetical protein